MGKVIILEGKLDEQRWLKLCELLRNMPSFREMVQNYASVQISFEEGISTALQVLISEGFEVYGVVDSTDKISKYITLY